MNVVLKWRNKYSGDEGFVKKVNKNEQHFVSTYDINEAKIYNGSKSLLLDQEILETHGETYNNEFYPVNLG